MAYDRDSFLSGLAVGRVLWRPYTISNGSKIEVYPCFLFGVPVDVNYTVIKDDEEYNCVSLTIRKLTNSTAVLPEPIYWMLFLPTSSYDAYWVAVSPDGQFINDHAVEIGVYGLTDNAEEIFLGGLIGWLQALGSGQIKYSKYTNFQDYINTDQILSQIPHMTTTFEGLEEYLTKARIVSTPSGYYVAGEVQ